MIIIVIIHYHQKKIKLVQIICQNIVNDIANKYGIKVGGINKLVPNLRDKIKYVVHYKNFQYYLSLEVKLIKAHRILNFKKSNWLKEYIKFNTEKRKNAVSEFERNFFKVINKLHIWKKYGRY